LLDILSIDKEVAAGGSLILGCIAYYDETYQEGIINKKVQLQGR
jgi:hypothetical protein